MKEDTNQFPILLSYQQKQKYPDWIRSVPWDFVIPHDDRAKRNHSQSIKRLSERGGLGPTELYVVLKDKPWQEVITMGITEEEAMKRIVELLNKWKLENDW